MRGPASFRHKLRRRLLGIAQQRRCACANQPSGADLKAIAHCERLAASVETLSPHLCAAVNETLSEPAAARRFAAIWAELPEALGTTVWPRDAAELTTTLIRHAAPDAMPSRRARLAWSSNAAPVAHNDPDAPRLATAVASDFTGGLAVVAPMLAVWQVSVGLRQWHQAALVTRHPATLAHVDAVPRSGTGRQDIPPHMATVTFTPALGAASCRVTVDLGGPATADAVISVVPRSSMCEAPLIVASIGDPAVSFAVAGAFAVTGLLALKAWGWLGRRGGRGTSPVHSAGSLRLAL